MGRHLLILLSLFKATLISGWLIDGDGNIIAYDASAYGLEGLPWKKLSKSSYEVYDDENYRNPYWDPDFLDCYDDDEEYEKNEETEIEDEETPYLKIIPPRALPLRRVRRRIIPRVTGKTTLDTDRGNRDPWNRERATWQTSSRGQGPLKPTGPMGSAKLYALYPHLAPPGWRSKRGGVVKARKRPEKIEEIEMEQQRPQMEQEQSNNREVEVMDQGYVKYHKDDVPVVVPTRRKPKSRMTKAIKEEIAEFALQYGNNAALEHFQTKLGIRIRAGAVDKYVQRLRDRMERRRLREEERY